MCWEVMSLGLGAVTQKQNFKFLNLSLKDRAHSLVL